MASSATLPVPDRDAILARYRSRLARFGPTVAALGSGSEERQALRHRILQEVGITDGMSVLDAGCGLGTFYRHCRDSGLALRYTGLDLVPEFIAHCQAAFRGEAPAPILLSGDLFAEDCALIRSQPVHDVVVASQVFNNRYEHSDNWELFQAAVSALFDRCREALAVDCLTTAVDYQEPHLFYYDPGQVLAFGLSLTRRATLRHDYPLYEQCLYLYRE